MSQKYVIRKCATAHIYDSVGLFLVVVWDEVKLVIYATSQKNYPIPSFLTSGWASMLTKSIFLVLICNMQWSQISSSNFRVQFLGVCALVFDANESSRLTDNEIYDSYGNGLDWLGSEYTDYMDTCEKLAYYMDYVNAEPIPKTEIGK